ncbi:fungal-specific transcription factor domain-containing protein [Aspergillus varians]
MPPRRIAKTKTFAGCWTCRRRKVKCDSYRPRCRRCGQSCEGYDVDLYWMGGEDERPCTVKRKAMLIHDPQLPAQIDLAEIDRMLRELEQIVEGVGAGIVGAFSAFAIDEAEESIENCCDTAATPNEARQLELYRRAMLAPRELPVYADSAVADLMDNYIHVVADLLQPARHAHNPYLSLYVPKAMEAAAAGLLAGVGGTPSQVGTALFHALLAVSAFHMHRHRPNRTRYSRQGRLHRLKAIESLQRSLAEPELAADCHTTMSAMLSMVSIDLMEGSMTDFWIHLDGCKKLQSVMEKDKTLQSPGTDQLLTICSFMRTLSRSTDPYLPPKRWSERPFISIDSLLENSPFRTDNHSLEFTYGITATLASYMDLTILLSQHLAYYDTHNLPVPHSLNQAASILHQALTTWSITNEPLASVPDGDNETFSLVTCHILAFHASLVIYFTTLTNWPHRHNSSPSPLHHYNRICVTNLLAAEALKSSYGSRVGWNAMAPIVWPGFIAACEAAPDERPLWRTWWVGVQRYCIGSIAILWEVVQEVWDRGDPGDRGGGRGPQWMGVLRESGRRVMSGG